MSIKAKINIGYANAKKLLALSKISFSENNVKKLGFANSNFSIQFLEVIQSKDYINIYDIARMNYDFDLLLKDDFIFQFTYEEDYNKILTKIRYAYYENPKNIEAYEEYIKGQGLDIDEVGDLFYEDYAQVKRESDLKQSVTPIRYDFDVTSYKGLKHSISHLHIGHNNEIRIPLSLIISPKAFVAFVLRHVYYKKWKNILLDTNNTSYYKRLKMHCMKLNDTHFTDEEKQDFYIV